MRVYACLWHVGTVQGVLIRLTFRVPMTTLCLVLPIGACRAALAVLEKFACHARCTQRQGGACAFEVPGVSGADLDDLSIRAGDAGACRGQ